MNKVLFVKNLFRIVKGFLEVAAACQVPKTERSCREFNVPNGH